MLGGKVEPDTQRAMVADLDDMNAIIDQFIDFARSEAAEPLAPVNLSEVARAAAERAARTGCRRALRARRGAGARCCGRSRSSALVDNLIGNALQARAAAKSSCAPRAAGGGAVLACSIAGPGIPRRPWSSG